MATSTNRFERIRATVTVITIGLCFFATIAGSEVGVSASIVRLIATVDGLQKTGTGFVAALQDGTAYIVTAAHVVEGVQSVLAEFPLDLSGTYQAEVFRIDPKIDLALLRVPNPPTTTRMLLISDREPKAADAASVVGFPQRAPSPRFAAVTLSSLEGSRLSLTGMVDSGSSGSPVLQGRVVVAVITEVEGLYPFAVPGPMLRLVVESWLSAAYMKPVTSTNADEAHIIPIAIQIQFDVATLSNFWPDDRRSMIERELSKTLTEHLEGIFPFWCFEPAPRQDSVRLVFRLKEEIEREGLLNVILFRDAEVHPKHEHVLGVLYKPNQKPAVLSRLAKRPQLFEEIVLEKLLHEGTHQSGLRRILMSGVPVATVGQWRTPPRGAPSVVLPLPWEPTFKKLAVSRFRLRGDRQDYPLEWFEADGHLYPARYPVKPHRQEETYNALQIFPPLKANAQELIRYTPRDVYLTEYRHRIVSMMKKGSLPGPPPSPGPPL